MSLLYNLAKVVTATSGTGTITLGAAVSGFLTFALAGVSDGETVSYGIRDGANSEAGRGVYTTAGTTLTRVVITSTNADAAIDLSGTAEVFITALAEDIIPVDSQYLTLSANTISTGERVFTPGDGLTGTDAGAGSTYTLALKDIGCRVYNNAAIATAHATQTALTFNSERWDTDVIHDTSTNSDRLTCKTAGKYHISGQVSWETNSTNERILYITLNAGNLRIANVSKASYGNDKMEISTDYVLAVGDYVQLQVYQASGFELDVLYTGATHNYSPEFMMHMIAEV